MSGEKELAEEIEEMINPNLAELPRFVAMGYVLRLVPRERRAVMEYLNKLIDENGEIREC